MSKYLYLLLVAALLASCTLFTGNENAGTAPSRDDIALLQKSFMSSYYAERTGAPAGSPRALTPFAGLQVSGSRATVPINKLTNTAFASLAPLSLANYPEPGQTTAFTAVLVAGTPVSTKVYDISATTTFAPGDIRAKYVEEYFVQDGGLNGGTFSGGVYADGVWTTDDFIVKKKAGVWALADLDGLGFFTKDQSARVKMLLTFTDGSTRTETIISSSTTLPVAGPKFAKSSFDINGSLDLSQAAVPALDNSNPNVMFSSIVQYYVTPSSNPAFWFWTGSNSQTILGIRYYTEVADPAGSTYIAYTTSYEKALSNLSTTGGTFTTTLPTVTVGSNFSTLAESVLRQQVVYGLTSTPYYLPTGVGAITTNIKTRVVNVTGSSAFYLSQQNSDYVSLSIPTGNADALLTANPALNLFTRTQSITPSAGLLPFAVATADISGLGDLATLFTSITEGSATTILSGAPTSTLTGGNAVSYTFVGQQAVGLTTTSTLDLSSAGTVEAWVWIKALTDTAGLVHNGVKVDFSDEGYSLQGWGNGGQIGIILDQKDPNPSGAYDYVLSSSNLAASPASPPSAMVWYYIAATWDKATKKIVLYINGSQSSSGTMNLTATGVRHDTDQVLIGSQLPTSYSTSYGYFGLNGKIVGASVTASALTAAQVLANYNLYKSVDKSGW